MYKRLAEYGKKSDLTFETFANETIHSHSLEQSLLLYTVFKNCEFEEIDFQNCDLEGCKFEGVRFISCSFIDTDIRSVVLTNCEFKACVFERALLSDVQVDSSRFSNCDFHRAAITESTFTNSILSTCGINRASFLHCSFFNCKFESMRIAECTFLYHIFKETTFNHVAINIDSLGYIYGLESQQLLGLDLIFLSEIQAPIPGDLATQIIENFVARKWLFAAALLSMSTGQISIIRSLDRIIEVFMRSAQTGIGLKRDEVRFLIRILDYFEKLGHIPLLFIQQAGNRVAISLADTDLSPSSRNILDELQAQLFLIANRLAENFDDFMRNLEPLGTSHSQIQVTVRHTSRPDVLFSDLINEGDYSFFPNTRIEGQLISEWEGSWHELIIMTTETLLAIVTSVALLNGLLTQVVKTRVLLKAIREPVLRKHSTALVASIIKAPPTPVSGIVQAGRNMLKAGTQNTIPNLDTLSSKFNSATKMIEDITVEAQP